MLRRRAIRKTPTRKVKVQMKRQAKMTQRNQKKKKGTSEKKKKGTSEKKKDALEKKKDTPEKKKMRKKGKQAGQNLVGETSKEIKDKGKDHDDHRGKATKPNDKFRLPFSEDGDSWKPKQGLDDSSQNSEEKQVVGEYADGKAQTFQIGDAVHLS